MLTDADLLAHCSRVSEYSILIANDFLSAAEDFANLHTAAVLHDIGKNFIRHDILYKSDRLTSDEYDMIKYHTKIGAMLVDEYFADPSITLAVKHHHERYDGQGYPSGLSGEDIPLLSRIICVADCFDVMRNGRFYSKPMTTEGIIGDFTANSGYQLDPQIVSTTVKLIESGILA